MSRQDIHLLACMFIIMQGMEAPFPHLCNSYSNKGNLKQRSWGKQTPNCIPFAPTPITSLYAQYYVRLANIWDIQILKIQ